MGSQQSKPNGVPDQAGRGDTAQFIHNTPLQTYPLGPLKPVAATTITPLTGSLHVEPFQSFPDRLPERPHKPSRLSLRKRKSSIKSPSLVASPSMPFTPSLPQSPESSQSAPTLVIQQASVHNPFQQIGPQITPPTSPRRLDTSKPFPFDGVSHPLKSVASSPNFTSACDTDFQGRTQRRSRLPPTSRLPLSPESSPPPHSRPSLADGISIPPARRLSHQRLHSDNAPATPISSPPSDTQDSHRNSFEHPAQSQSARTEAAPNFYQYFTSKRSWPDQNLDVRKPNNTTKQPTSQKEAPYIRPEFRRKAIARGFHPGPSVAKTHSIAEQEELDRILALQIQQEEDGVLFNGLSGHLRAESTPSAGPRSRSDVNDGSIPESNPWHAEIRRRMGNEDAVYYDDEVTYYADSAYAQKLQAEEDAEFARQEDADAQIALKLQEEEEEKRRQEAAAIKTRECVVCGDACPIPELPALVDCAHQPQTCATCYQSWIESELNSKSWNEIRCPENECCVILQHHEVQQYATAEVYQK